MTGLAVALRTTHSGFAVGTARHSFADIGVAAPAGGVLGSSASRYGDGVGITAMTSQAVRGLRVMGTLFQRARGRFMTGHTDRLLFRGGQRGDFGHRVATGTVAGSTVGALVGARRASPVSALRQRANFLAVARGTGGLQRGILRVRILIDAFVTILAGQRAVGGLLHRRVIDALAMAFQAGGGISRRDSIVLGAGGSEREEDQPAGKHHDNHQEKPPLSVACRVGRRGRMTCAMMQFCHAWSSTVKSDHPDGCRKTNK